jgi:hypothetical protein
MKTTSSIPSNETFAGAKAILLAMRQEYQSEARKGMTDSVWAKLNCMISAQMDVVREFFTNTPLGTDRGEWMRENVELSYIPDPTFQGLERDLVYSGTRRFAGSEKSAYEINIFGRLSLPTGVSVLASPLKVEQNAGGNNDHRWATLPAGSQVAYYPTGGQGANLLWSSVQP